MNKIDRYWEQYRRSQVARGLEAPENYEDAFYFGSNPASAVEIAELVLARIKTATGSLVWHYQHEGRRPPQKGDVNIVTDGRGTPLCIIESTEVRILPYNQVDDQFAYDGGEGDRTLESWRDLYWEYILRECDRLGQTPEENIPLVCERFRVIYQEPLGVDRDEGS